MQSEKYEMMQNGSDLPVLQFVVLQYNRSIVTSKEWKYIKSFLMIF